MWGNIAIAFILAFIVSFMATPYTIKIADKIGAVDVPKDKRRMHTKRMPKFGGPAVILGFLVSMIYGNSSLYAIITSQLTPIIPSFMLQYTNGNTTLPSNSGRLSNR